MVIIFNFIFEKVTSEIVSLKKSGKSCIHKTINLKSVMLMFGAQLLCFIK